MYVTTFYSFKGGVGRTMALANVAVQLAQMGRRVLIVDFDLEAPGLDTLALPQSKNPTPGIIEFVSQYLATGVAPDAAQYMYEADWTGRQGGRLWVMPAGRNDDTYSSRLNKIDWAALYEEHDGFVLFEDLKAQWRQLVAPDYVLIDSRTGHTDVGGICTRHLPDSVVIFFFPNEQNLRGLQKVVHDIRSEGAPPREKSIELHFVMSNVPDLDDEDLILASRLKEFETTLQIGAPLTVIHRYDSLALLNQAVFTRERPRSRLAREYVDLTERLIGANNEDREGALRFLRSLRRLRRHTAPETVAERIQSIVSTHAHDGEILYSVATIRLSEGRVEEALAFLNEAIQVGHATQDALLQRAECRRMLEDSDGAASDALRVLGGLEGDSFGVEHAIRLIRVVRPQAMPNVASMTAVKSLSISDRVWLATTLCWNKGELSVAREILSEVLSDPALPEQEKANARSELAFTLIGLGQFQAALNLLALGAPGDGLPTIRAVFNSAMATWGLTGAAPRELFERVLDVDRVNPKRVPTANYLQCLAVAACGAGQVEEASQLLNKARQRIMRTSAPDVSCWRFLMVAPEEFLKDLDALAAVVAGTPMKPAFIEAALSGVTGDPG